MKSKCPSCGKPVKIPRVEKSLSGSKVLLKMGQSIVFIIVTVLVMVLVMVLIQDTSNLNDKTTVMVVGFTLFSGLAVIWKPRKKEEDEDEAKDESGDEAEG